MFGAFFQDQDYLQLADELNNQRRQNEQNAKPLIHEEQSALAERKEKYLLDEPEP